ncbi:hypothetical protein GCM10007874_15620 [Labrys miyagiensis]|uniref:SGNH hydrolase-type esterase domain-containing protein n=1 Tax=Labrys miyagiensis TaxID=346912 RepID=A0ABQ6CEF8_9HYPH|nr:SGNH/GDSL hydrolase family protein [Labrys miyagiensis]GLS18545.1 hypothetical protein GCM10007874_15620 [Labrys miyagiensis]
MNNSIVAPADVRAKIEDDIQKRTLTHQANIARLAAAKEFAQTLDAASRHQPKVFLAQGDSWFDYPLIGNGPALGQTDIIAQLRHMGDTPPIILNLAHHGDAATSQMSLPKQERMINALRDPANWLNGKPDAILFSAGGDDIAGDQFCIFLDFNANKATGLNDDRFTKALGMVEACYLELFALRDRVATGVPIIGHGYDFPIPNGRHPICAGPWLKPSLDFCNWSVAQGTGIARQALTKFHDMLTKLASVKSNNFILVETQGVLTPAEWANELHPTPSGFGKMADKFFDAISKNFTG